MKTWIVRFVSLYVFNVVVLLVIGLLTPAHVGWAVLWASVILTLAELFVKPLLQGAFTKSAAKSAGERTRIGEALVQALIVLAVAAIIWVITLLLTGVNARGSWFWAYVLPPLIIAIGWVVYARIDDLILEGFDEIFDMPGRRVAARWVGTYASASDRTVLVDKPLDNTRLVLVTGGTGASTGFALGEQVISDIFA